MAKFIVTGGLGFIGSNLIEYLINLGHFVINIDNGSYSSNFYNVKDFKNNPNYRFHKSSIDSQTNIIKIIKRYNPKCIFNLAAETHVDRSIDSPSKFIKTNINGVYSLLETLVKFKKIKLIHVSTDEVFGNIKSNLRADERTAYKPKNPYAATKAASDHLIRAYINTFKIKAIITNCCNNYGPRQNPEKLIPKIITNIFKKEKIQIYGKGQNSREWIHVLDHCKALYQVFKKGVNGETYNIGSNKNIKNIDLVKKIIFFARKRNFYSTKSKINFIKDRPGHDLRYALNSNKISKKLKWASKININNGLINTLEWYARNKKFYKFIKNKNFKSRLGKNR